MSIAGAKKFAMTQRRLSEIAQSLRPSERRTLDALLGPHDAYQISADCGLSRLTIDNQSRRVYAAYGVHSRVALMALFVVRLRSDPP